MDKIVNFLANFNISLMYNIETIYFHLFKKLNIPQIIFNVSLIICLDQNQKTNIPTKLLKLDIRSFNGTAGN